MRHATSIARAAALAALLALLPALAACGGDSKGGSKDAPKAAPPASASKGDFSSPAAAAQTFFAAAVAKDANLLALCFSARSEDEFAEIREKKLAAKDLDELSKQFEGATVAGPAEIEGDTAEVPVSFGGRTDKFHMVKEGDAWKIKGF